jgi:hypothetical protein
MIGGRPYRKVRAATHEVAVVATAGVVVLQPALELGVEVGQAGEVLAVERGPVELLEGGALEAFADRVVVGRAGRDATVADAELFEVAGEGFKILASGLRQCVQDEQAAEQAGYSQAELEKLFLQLR